MRKNPMTRKSGSGCCTSKCLTEAVARAREEGVAYQLDGRNLLYSRKISDVTLSRLSAEDRKSKRLEYFMLTRDAELVRGPTGVWTPKEITGKYLTRRSTAGQDDKNNLAVHFTFDTQGGNLFWELTSRNKPAGTGEGSGFHRQLAIILDGHDSVGRRCSSTSRSAPTVRSAAISPRPGWIVWCASSGAPKRRCPPPCGREPVSENTMGATLGDATIYSGTLSIGIAFAAILIFMAVYYRFAGLVACFALLANLILTVAFMVVVLDAVFTLARPGRARAHARHGGGCQRAHLRTTP